MFIFDDSSYADSDGQPGTYRYNASTKTITWQTGSYQTFIGYYVPEDEVAFGSSITSPRIYNRDRAGSGTPFDGKSRESAFGRCGEP